MDSGGYIKKSDAESVLWQLRKGFRRVEEKCAVGSCILEIKDMPTVDLDAILNPRIQELAKADAEGRVVILPTKTEEQRALVERALDIRLLDWQVAYIWGNSSYVMPGRATGKTLAHVIRLCLSEGSPLHMYPKGKDWGLCDVDYGIAYHRIYREYVRDTLYKLKMGGGLKLRTIYFHPEEAKEEERQ